MKPLPRAICQLASEVGGAPLLAARCGVRESTLIRWIAAEAAPSADELYVLELIARRAGIPFPSGRSLSEPPPRITHVTTKRAAGVAENSDDEDPERLASDDSSMTYEEYREWLQQGRTGEGQR